MVKDHLGITFRVRVSGWMVGWMDGWMDGSIDQSPSIHLHQYIDLFLHLPDHSNMPNLQIRIYHSGRLFWAPGEGSSTTTPSGVIGDCETVQFCVFSPHFFSTHGKKTMEKATQKTNDMYVCTYIYICLPALYIFCFRV